MATLNAPSNSQIVSWTDFLNNLPRVGGPIQIRTEAVLLGPQSGKYGPYYVLRMGIVDQSVPPTSSGHPRIQYSVPVRIGEKTIQRMPALLDPAQPIITLTDMDIKHDVSVAQHLKERKTIKIPDQVPDAFSNLNPLPEGSALPIDPITDPVGHFIAYVEGSMHSINRALELVTRALGEMQGRLNHMDSVISSSIQAKPAVKDDDGDVFSLLNDNLMSLQADIYEIKNHILETPNERPDQSPPPPDLGNEGAEDQ